MTMSDNIAMLRNAIEEKVGRKMCTPKDFNFLSDKIFDELHQHVSTSTLKRLWGYIPSTIMPRKATLDLLAQFAGYANWSGFCGEDILPPTANVTGSPRAA